MLTIERRELHKILNDLKYTGERLDNNMAIFESIINECIESDDIASKVYLNYIKGVKVPELMALANCKTRKVYHYNELARMHILEEIELKDMETGYVPLEQPKSSIVLESIEVDNDMQRDFELFGIKDIESFKAFILSTGPSWFLRFTNLILAEAVAIEQELDIKHPPIHVTDDIAKAVLKAMKYNGDISYRQLNAVRLILQGKASVDPVMVDTYIHFVMGVDYVHANMRMTAEQVNRVRWHVSAIVRFMRTSRNLRAIEEGIDNITPCTNFYLISLANRSGFNVKVDRKDYKFVTHTLEQTPVSKDIITMLKKEDLHTTKDVLDYIHEFGKSWYNRIPGLKLFHAGEVLFWLGL